METVCNEQGQQIKRLEVDNLNLHMKIKDLQNTQREDHNRTVMMRSDHEIAIQAHKTTIDELEVNLAKERCEIQTLKR